jgi:PEGA domain
MRAFMTIAVAAIFTAPAFAIEPVASGAKVYIDTTDQFGSYLAAAFRVKSVPMIVVTNRSIADYEAIGHAESQKAGWAKILLTNHLGSREEATFNVVDLRTSEVVFAYNYKMENSYRGKQSSAESCAKHLAHAIAQGGRLASSLPPLGPEHIAARKQEDAERAALRRLAIAARYPTSSMINPVVERPQQVDVKTGVTITSTPAGAEVLIDAVYWGATPTAELTRIPAGEHVITIKKRGFRPWEQRVSVADGEVRSVSAELEPVPLDPSKPRIAGLED